MIGGVKGVKGTVLLTTFEKSCQKNRPLDTLGTHN